MMSAAIVIFPRLLHEISRKYLISKLFKFQDIETMLFSTLHLIYVMTSRRFHSGMVVSRQRNKNVNIATYLNRCMFLCIFSLIILIYNGCHSRSHAWMQMRTGFWAPLENHAHQQNALKIEILCDKNGPSKLDTPTIAQKKNVYCLDACY